MLLQIIIILIQALGFEQKNPTQSLYPQQTRGITREQIIIILIPILMILFVTLTILFMPGTESGIVYNGELA